MSVRKVGRPTSLTRHVHQVVTRAMRSGNFLETAAALAGVDPATLRRWIARGERERRRRQNGEPPDRTATAHVRLAQEIERAAATAQSEVVGRILRSGREDWRAAAWWLERRHANGWGLKPSERILQREFDAMLDQLQSKLDHAAFEQFLQAVADDD